MKTYRSTLPTMATWLVLALHASAATKTWDGSTNGFWSANANWSGNTAPVAGDILIFPPNAARFTMTNDFSPARAFQSVQFTGSNYVLRGNTLILSNGISATATADTACIVNTDIDLRGSQTFSVADADADIELRGAFLHLGAHTLAVNGAGDTLIAGVIDGAGGLTKAGTGELRLDGTLDNIFGGGTVVSEGLLTLAKTSGRLAVPGDISIGGAAFNSPPATVRLINANQIGNVAVVFVGVSSLLDLNGQNETITDLSLVSGDVSTGNGVLTLLGDITADADLDDCFVDGRLALSAGTHAFESTANPGFRGLRVRAAISGSGGLSLTGRLIELAGTNSYTGLTTINSGETIITADAGLGSTAAGTVLAGGQLRLLDVAVVGEDLTIAGASQMITHGVSSWSGAVQANETFVLLVADPGEFTLTGVVSGPGNLNKSGFGTLKLFPLGINAYGGTTHALSGIVEIWGGTIEGIGTVRSIPGRLIVGGNAVVRYAAATTGEAIAGLAPVQVNTGAWLDLNGKSDDIGELAIGGGQITTGTGTLTVHGDIEAFAIPSTSTATIGGRLALASGRRVFTIENEGANPRLDISAVVSGTQGFVKLGPGELRLSGANAFDGPVCVGEGTLIIGHLLALGATSGGTVLSNSTILDFSIGGMLASEPLLFAGNATLRSVAGLNTWSGAVTLDSAATVVCLDEAARLNLSGSVSGDSGLIKIGNGALELSGGAPNTYRGGTEVLDGTVLLNKTAFDGAIPGPLQVGTPLAPPFPFTSNVVVRWLRANQVTNFFLDQVALGAGAPSMATGNGDGLVQPNECNTLLLPLVNRTGRPVTGVTARLTSATPGVFITERDATYPDIPGGANRTNLTPFQFYTTPEFACGTIVEFDLAVTTASNGMFTVTYSVASPGPATPRTFTTAREFPLPDRSTVNAPIVVTGIIGVVGDINVTMHLRHENLAEVSAVLVAPDGQVAALVPIGLSGTALGTNCAGRGPTAFDDDATTPIASGSPPYPGEFRPASPLGVFNGSSAALANGTWQVRVRDNPLLLNGTTGILHCASLTIRQCGNGGGICAPCNGPFLGSITTNDFSGPVFLGGNTRTACGSPCPQLVFSSLGRSDIYVFTNGSGTSVCVTATVAVPCANNTNHFFSTAFLSNRIPTGFCAIAGSSGVITDGLPTNYAFRVPSNGVFAVWVTGLGNATCSEYTLRVDGFSCPVSLTIGEAASDRISFWWPSYGSAYELQCSTQLPFTNAITVTNLPVVINGEFVLTNNIAGPRQFYRLRKP